MEIKRIEVPFEIKNTKEDDKYFHVMGLANTWDIDQGDDRSIKGCFAESIEEMANNPQKVIDGDYNALMPGLWQHNWSEPIGVYVEVRETDEGLYTHSIYPKSDTFVSGRVIPQLKVGSVRKQSIGFIPNKVSFEEINGREIRNLEKVTLKEVSLVTFPMNEGAVVTDMKGATRFQDLPLADVTRKWDSAQAVTRVRDFTKSTETPARGYRRAFFWFDSEDAEAFGAYKLPFADVVDGRLVAVPRAIFAAAAAMRGGRGGVDLPDGDRSGVEAHINRYYDKMDRESPLKEKHMSIDVIDAKMITEREFESMLKAGSFKFSNEASKIIIKRVKDGFQWDAGDGDQREAESSTVEAKLDELLNLLETK